EARRAVRVHPLLLLLDQLPELLVELRQVSRPRGSFAGVSLDRRQPRRGDGRAPEPARGSVPPLPLPHDHELRERLPQGPEPGQSDRGNEEADRRTRGVSDESYRGEGLEDVGVPTGASPDADHSGWYSWGDFPRGSFAAATGRLLFKPDGPGRALTRMFPTEAHVNMGGSLHGGAVMSFIDMSLFAGGLCAGMARGHYVTLDLTTHFLARGMPGTALEAEVELIRQTRS